MCNTRVNITTSQHTFPYRTTKDKSFSSVFKFRNSIHLSNRLDSPPFFPSFEKPGNHKPRIKRIEIQFKRNHSMTIHVYPPRKLKPALERVSRTDKRTVCNTIIQLHDGYGSSVDNANWTARIMPNPTNRTSPHMLKFLRSSNTGNVLVAAITHTIKPRAIEPIDKPFSLSLSLSTFVVNVFKKNGRGFLQLKTWKGGSRARRVLATRWFTFVC